MGYYIAPELSLPVLMKILYKFRESLLGFEQGLVRNKGLGLHIILDFRLDFFRRLGQIPEGRCAEGVGFLE